MLTDWRPNETWMEWRAREVRYEKWMRRLGLVAGLTLACVLCWCAIGAALGQVP